MWIVFALGAALLASFNPIINKRLLADTNVSVVAWAGQAFGLPLLALNLLLFFRPLPRVDNWFFIGVLGSSVFNTLAHLTATQELKEGDASLVAPMFIFSPAVTLLVSAITLGEIPTPVPLIGVGLVIIGAYVLGCPHRFEVFALMGAGQVAPFNESHFCQHGQGPVYYSQADVCVLFTCPREDAFGIEVFSAVSITSSTIWRWRVTRRHPFARQPVFQYE